MEKKTRLLKQTYKRSDVRMWAGIILAHVNIIISVWCGAVLATCARLQWDPLTFVGLRALFPTEYRVLLAALPALFAALLLLSHLVLLAQRRRSGRLYIYYCAATCALVVGELALAGWLLQRVRAWLAVHPTLLHALQFTDDMSNAVLRVLIAVDKIIFGTSLPKHLLTLLQEVEDNTPRNVYASVAGGALLVALQLLGAALALRARHALLPRKLNHRNDLV